MAHELTHVVQQGGASSQVQRECGVDECCLDEATSARDGLGVSTTTRDPNPDFPQCPEAFSSFASQSPDMEQFAVVNQFSAVNQSSATESQAGMVSLDTSMSVLVPMVTSEPEESEFDRQVQEELERFLTGFSAISVTVQWVEKTDTQCVLQETQVFVHPPYFMNVTARNRPTAAPRTVERYDAALGNRRNAERYARLCSS